ncbi:MAG TPA: DUF932 domain-containing protein [Planctomycetota bacterium]|nr:DUF932 domain-containing protein [Planctomycetota bacterium]
MTANVDTMFYHGARPWHGLGVALDHPATAEEAMKAAGLDWTVELVSATACGLPIPRAQAVVRSDRQEPLGIAGTRFQPIQNRVAFRFMDHLVGEGKAVYTTAGSLSGGRRVWMLARIPGDLWVTEEDNVGKYLLLVNPHYAGSSCLVFFTGIRAVCDNTVRAAISEAKGSMVRIRHAGDIDAQVEDARRVLGISLKYFDGFQEQAREFARLPLLNEHVARYFESVVPDPQGADPSRAKATRDRLLQLFETGKGNALPSVRGSLWAAVNAVAQFVDHERPTRTWSGESEALKRFESAQFGSGGALRERAWNEALGLLA